VSTATARRVDRALSTRRERYEDEVKRLLDATFQVMRERDTVNPSVAEILRTAGLSTTAFYRHFPTKDELLVTLLERAHELTRSHLEARLATCADPAERVAEWVRALFDLLRTDELVVANRPFLLAHPRLLEHFPDEIGRGFDALVAPLADAIDQLQAGADPSGSATDARLAMQHVFGILIDRAALRRTSDGETVDAVVAYTLRAVAGDRIAVRPNRRRGRAAH
jgi:AcrR family transcriptional regulator